MFYTASFIPVVTIWHSLTMLALHKHYMDNKYSTPAKLVQDVL